MKKAALLILAIVHLLIIAGFWANYHVNHQMGNLLAGDFPLKLLAWGRLAGLLTAFGILFLLMLISRAKWIEGVFGLDRLARVHHFVGFSMILLLFAHSALLTAGHAMQEGVGYSEKYVDFLKNWEDMPGAIIGQVLVIIAIIVSIFIILKKIKYETWYFSHLFLYIAFALAFGHQIAIGSDFTDNRCFKYYWCALYVFVLGTVLYYRFINPLRYFLNHRFRVARLVREADDVTSVYIYGKDLDKYPVRAGQFLVVRFLAKGFRWEAHPFSVSAFPDGRQLRLTIKQLGDFTKRISQLKDGTPVLIDGPHGIFTASNARSEKVLMIAGGIGITPVRSVAEEMVSAGRDIVLIYGNRNSKSIVFRKELDELAAKAAGRIKVVHVMSDEPGWQGEKGRIDRERIQRLVPDLADRDVFLCGPPVMMDSIRAILISLNVPSSRIHYERFAL